MGNSNLRCHPDLSRLPGPGAAACLCYKSLPADSNCNSLRVSSLLLWMHSPKFGGATHPVVAWARQVVHHWKSGRWELLQEHRAGGPSLPGLCASLCRACSDTPTSRPQTPLPGPARVDTVKRGKKKINTPIKLSSWTDIRILCWEEAPELYSLQEITVTWDKVPPQSTRNPAERSFHYLWCCFWRICSHCGQLWEIDGICRIVPYIYLQKPH